MESLIAKQNDKEIQNVSRTNWEGNARFVVNNDVQKQLK